MKTKILVIESDSLAIKTITNILERNNYEAIIVKDTSLGVDMAKAHMPDLILCDVLMSHMDGYAVLKELNKFTTKHFIPFIFLTARIDRAQFRKSIELGADDYIFRPYNEEEILKCLETRLNKSRMIKDEINSKEQAYYHSLELNKLDEDDTIFINKNNRPYMIKISDIKVIEAENQYTRIINLDNKAYLIRTSMRKWETALPNRKFKRIHRSTIINLNYVIDVEKAKSRSLKLKVQNMDRDFEISRRYEKKLRDQF